jgi:tRNA pseudouridine38-40 synthase
MEAINAHLRPEPIAIIGCEAVADDWHARFSCVARAYDYRIHNRRAPLTVEDGLVWRVPQPLDSDAMHTAAQQLIGRHDFTTFRSAHCQADSPVRTLDRLDVVRNGDRISVHAQARSFLHHQVRSMVGCLVLVGTGNWSVADLKGALDARDRTALGHNAPPDGLYFIRADYPA